MNLTGQILVSMPSMADERFYKTLIFLCAHSKEGSMGIIINKKIDFDMYPDLLQQLGIDQPLIDKKIYIRYGGPVETSRGFVLHSDDVVQKDSLQIDKGIALTSTIDIFKDLSKGKGPKESILALGYAGWGPGQLDNEIKNNGWITLNVDSSFIFDENVSEKWNQAYKMIGFNPTSLTNNFGKA